MRRARHLLSALAGLALLMGACAETPAPEPGLPDGALLVARSAALRVLAVRLERPADTRLARMARELGGHLPDCEVVAAIAGSGDPSELLGALACDDGREDLAPLRARLAEHDLVFAGPLADGDRARGSLSVSAAGDIDLELRLPAARFAGAGALLVPGSDPPGPAQLSGAGALVHARLRPAGGIDLAALVPAGGQGDRLFSLKNRLFAGAVLDGTWEIAMYPPAGDDALPQMALAVGFAHRPAAVAAMEAFVAELQRSWPLRRVAFAVGEAEGACLPDVNLLPGLAPCYAATTDALVVGWNAASVRTALRGPAAARLGATGGLVVDLARIAELDAALAQRAGGVSARAADRAGWRELRVEGFRAEGGVRLRARVLGDASS